MLKDTISAAKMLSLAVALAAMALAAPCAAADALFSGKAYPETRAELRTFGIGKIKEVFVTIGSFVKDNSSLLTYEGDAERLAEIKQKLSPAKISDLEWKKAQLVRLLDKERRDVQLVEYYLSQNMGTASQLENHLITLHSLETQLDAINEKLTNARDDLKAEQYDAFYTLGIRDAKSSDVKRLLRMHAPIQGYVLWMNPEFHPGAEMKHDVRAFVIGDMRRVKLVCEAYEGALQGIKEGQPVSVRFDAIQDRVFPGVMANRQWAAANVGDKDKPSVFEVEVMIDNQDLAIKEGYVGHVYPAQ